MSDNLSVNFGDLVKNVGSLDITPVAPGEYECVVAEATAGESSGGKLMYKIRYKIMQPGPQMNRTVFNNVTLTTDNPNALRMFFVNMKAMGLDESYFATSPSPSSVASALIGKPCKIVVTHREYQGVMREQVSSIKPMPTTPVMGVPVASPAAAIPAPVVASAPAPVVAAEPAPVAPVVAAEPVASAPEPAAQGNVPTPPPVPF